MTTIKSQLLETFEKNHSNHIKRVDMAENSVIEKSSNTELYVWGSDQFGQLGLGHKYLQSSKSDGNKVLRAPKSCSFSIQITDISCGEDFAFLLTSKGLLYAMGSNQFGKLGIKNS